MNVILQFSYSLKHVYGDISSADASSQPIVQFPKSLLLLPENTTISTVTAYLTVPAPPPEKDSHFCTMGFFNSKGGTDLHRAPE